MSAAYVLLIDFIWHIVKESLNIPKPREKCILSMGEIQDYLRDTIFPQKRQLGPGERVGRPFIAR